MELDSPPWPPPLLLLPPLLVHGDSVAICLSVEELVEEQVGFQALVASFVRSLRGSSRESYELLGFDRRPCSFQQVGWFWMFDRVWAILSESLDADSDRALESLRAGRG